VKKKAHHSLLNFYILTLKPYPSIAQAIAKDWEKLGVRAELQPVPYDELAEGRLETRNYEAALVELNFSHFPRSGSLSFLAPGTAARVRIFSLGRSPGQRIP